MDFGMRQIRTAGKGSGSIELTLPAGLRDLVGLPCRVVLRDGGRPDIVLQPDLRQAHFAFNGLWHAMAIALLGDDGDIPVLPLAAFDFGLQPTHGNDRKIPGEQILGEQIPDRPFLCWRDGLALAGEPPHHPLAVSRTLTAFGHAMAVSLAIDPTLAAGFGAACGYLAAGVPANADGQGCDLAAAVLCRHPEQPALLPHIEAEAITQDAAGACADGVMSDAFWRYAAPLLTALADLFVGLTADSTGHPVARGHRPRFGIAPPPSRTRGHTQRGAVASKPLC